jgi:hypothetical protein
MDYSTYRWQPMGTVPPAIKRLVFGPYDLLLRGLVAACGTRNIQAANAARELPGPFDDEPLQAAITRVMADAPPSIIPEL